MYFNIKEINKTLKVQPRVRITGRQKSPSPQSERNNPLEVADQEKVKHGGSAQAEPRDGENRGTKTAVAQVWGGKGEAFRD